MPWRLFLDEHLSPTVADRLMVHGHYVFPLCRNKQLLGREDWDLVKWCFEHDFVLCTKNYQDFETEHAHTLARGDLHCGMLILGDWRTEEVYWSLRQFTEEHDFADMVNQCVWVPLADPDYIEHRSRE